MYHGSMESGGQGVYLAAVSREFARAGHDVHVISAPPYPALDPAVRLHALRTHSFPAMLADQRAFFGIAPRAHWHPLNFVELATTRFALSPLILVFGLRALALLRRIEARTGPFDIIHDNQSLGYGVLAVKSLLGRTVVANVHHPLDVDRASALRAAGSVPARIRRVARYPQGMQRTVARRLDALISGSRASAALVERTWQIPPGLMHAIYDGVDGGTFHPGDDGERERGALLFVGNSEDANKGLVHLLRALALLPEGMPAHLYLVGGPPGERTIAAREIARLGIEAHTTIVGRVTLEQLAAWYRRAQILVSPSIYEGFGLPAAEAMASGTPVIASDGGALPEVVADGECGIIVPAGDARALAEALAALLADPDRRRAMGASGRARVLERFTWDRTAQETERLYRAVLHRAAPP